jgi:two-component system response regulator FixJ
MQQQANEQVIYVVDDDEAVCKAMKFFLEDAGHQVKSFTDPETFLAAIEPETSGCVVLDLRLDGLSGIDVEDQLQRLGYAIPIIMVSGHGSISAAAEAMRKGAIDFLEKPVDRQKLLQRVDEALNLDAQRRRKNREVVTARLRLATLTPRESELLDLIVDGMSNKQIAAELGIAEKTVANHRANLIEKMNAVNTADLVRLAMLSRSEIVPEKN